MLAIVTPEQMRAVDAAAPVAEAELIERAGRSVARAAREMLGGVYGRRVAVIAGPGNNGADALVAARVLTAAGVKVGVSRPGEPIESWDCDLVIDGAFGTGLARPYTPGQAPADVPVLAVDIPSGVDGLTGELVGQPLGAERTVTFAAIKPGLLMHPGASRVGRLQVADIGLDVCAGSVTVESWLFERADGVGLVPVRAASAHKWNHAVLVVAGSPGMTGAAGMACSAALRSGAGMVHAHVPQGSVEVPEVVARSELPAGTELDRFDSLVIGPGLGRSSEATELAIGLLDAVTDRPIVVDGDGLSMLGERPRLRSNIVLTPHDGEYTRLWGGPPGSDRFDAARRLAAVTGAVVLLKGPLTVVSDPGGWCWAVNRGDERLATAGTGDVLAGAIGALLAAGLAPRDACALGAWVHGDAALARPRIGMVASDLLAGLGASMDELAWERQGCERT